MRSVSILCGVAVALALTGAAGAGTYQYEWNFTNASDYYVNGDYGTAPLYQSYVPVITEGVGAYVPSRPWINSDDDPPYGSDWASVFARVNTQATNLRLSQVTGGGFTLTGMNHPDAVYGSLYLSPTGGSGSTVLILLSPMARAGSGTIEYTFDLDTHADYRTRVGGVWSAYDPDQSGTFGEIVDMLSANTDYVAFFGPQIDMSNTSETTFTVTQIGLNPVPEPFTMATGFLAVSGLGAYVRRHVKRAKKA